MRYPPIALPLAALAILLSSSPAGATRTDGLPHLSLTAEIDPSTGTVRADARFRHVCLDSAHTLYLNRAFTIDGVTDARGSITAWIDTAAPSMPYASIAKPVRLGRPTCDPHLRYHGAVRDTISDVNVVSPRLVELASYAGWYPASPAMPRFSFDADLVLPARFTVITNADGVPAITDAGGDRERHIRVRSRSAASDVVVVASPDFRASTTRVPDVGVHVYDTRRDGTRRQALAVDLGRVFALYRAWFGAPRSGGDLRVVDSPRGGWGYSRLPLVLGSERTDDAEWRLPAGRARSVEGNAHELAHFWWRLADPATPDDWLNEGLAEYSAWAASAQLFGPSVRDSLLAQYRDDVRRARDAEPILRTSSDSRHRYVNRYERPTLLLARLEQRWGAPRVRRMLRSFYAEHSRDRRATTEDFLGLVGQSLDRAAADWLRACLRSSSRLDCGLTPDRAMGR